LSSGRAYKMISRCVAEKQKRIYNIASRISMI